jgi:heterodisulfide reductase subunit D
MTEEVLVETIDQKSPIGPIPSKPEEPLTDARPEPIRELPLFNLSASRLIQLESCTRCGECLNWCPVHDQDPREQIIPRKKITDFLQIVKTQRSLLTRIMKQEKVGAPLKKLLGAVFRYQEIGQPEIDAFVQNLYECSTCGQCQIVCPANIDTVSLWEDIRRLVVTAGYGPLEPQKVLVKSVKAYDNPWQQPRAGRTKWARRAQKDNVLIAPPREIKKTGAQTLLFLGCTAVYDVNVKQIAISTLNILESLGVDYGCLGGEEKCCGSVLLRMGDPEFERIAGDNIRQLNSLGIQTLVSSCSGCFKTIKEDYPKVGKLNFEVLHTVEFLRRMLEDKKLPFVQPLERKVTYHDPCHLGRASGVFDDPRVLMEAIPGLELIEMPRSGPYSRCCGAGGGLKSGYPDIQNKMAQERVREAESTGASELISACPFCYAGLQVGIKALDSPLVMKDLSCLVEESLIKKVDG